MHQSKIRDTQYAAAFHLQGGKAGVCILTWKMRAHSFSPNWARSVLPKSPASSLIERMHAHLPVPATFMTGEHNVQYARFALRPANRVHHKQYAVGRVRALRNHYSIWCCPPRSLFHYLPKVGQKLTNPR